MKLLQKLTSLLLVLLFTSPVFAQSMWDEYRGVMKADRPDVHTYELGAPNGAYTRFVWVSTEVTLSGATTAATSLIPAKSTYFGCVAEVTQTVTGATTWDLGDGSDQDRWVNDRGLTVGTKTSESDFTATPYGFSTSAVSPTFTANGSNFTGGKARVSCLTQTQDH